MAIGTDFSVTVSGDIRHVSGTTNYTVLELHRWLQDLADDAQASGDDLVDITSLTPSIRSTDSIITLNSPYNIDDTAAQFLYGGSITQDGGDTLYSGLQILGAVNTAATQIYVVQDGALYDGTAPFWGTQATGGYNGNSAAGILARFLVKTRQFGADIDGKRLRVQIRHWGDTYAFFNVSAGTGESVAAVSSTPDAQNDTSRATVTAYADVLNSGGTANAPTGGFQLIDLGNGNGSKEYYSQWTFGAQGDGLKALWEYGKDLTQLSPDLTVKTVDGIGGEFFLGITHEIVYQTGSGTFQERETLVWGTDITYDTLAGGTFSAGDYVTIGVLGAAGKVLYDNGSTNMIVALEDTSITLVDGDTITVADGVGAVTADINVTILDNADPGGEGIILAHDDNTGTGEFYIQLVSGAAPVTTAPLRGITSAATAVVNGAPTAETVPSVFLGSYTGSIIGAYGIGIDPNDLTSVDTLEPLTGASQQPPNNVTFTVTGLVATEDRVLVGPRAAGILDLTNDTTASLLTDNVSTSLTVTTAIPTDTPSAGDIRIQDDNGVYVQTAYASYTGSVYTLSAAYQGSDNADATIGNYVFPSYIDELVPSGTTASFTSVYLADRDLFVRVRDGGTTPIVTFEAPAQLTNTGGSIAAIRNSDS